MSESFKTVVIGTSLTDFSDGVVRTGAAVARAAGTSPWLVHAYLPPAYGPEVMDGGWLEKQADLAILGTHGRSGIERLTIGSVAAEVMHQAPCNLLLIPPKAGAGDEDTFRVEPLKMADWIYIAGEVPAAAGMGRERELQGV